VINYKNYNLEQSNVEREIREAFKDVTRAGGMSWSEAALEDGGSDFDDLSKEELAVLDKDSSWEDLVEDDSWNDSPGIGGMTFLDPIGFAYYLPVIMIRSMRKGVCGGPFLLYEITINSEGQRDRIAALNNI
jgi:hypothetical protein